MRLSAELLGSCEQRTNALGEREIILRGLAIPAIEHLGVTRDAFDAMDFTDNRLGRLENFPRLLRLTSLCVAANVIEAMDPNNLSKNLPNLTHLDLTHNQITSLFEVSNLGKASSKLEFLSLHGNPVTRRQHYRLFTIKHIPSLKVLDYTKISKAERERAERLAKSAAGAALEADVQGEGRDSNSNAKTFIPGEGRSAEESFVTNFSPEEKARIREMVANAASPAEIEEIERSVRRGILPTNNTTNNNNIDTKENEKDDDTTNDLKRPPSESENGNGNENGQAKKSRVEEVEEGGES